jgi:ribonuclease-3
MGIALAELQEKINHRFADEKLLRMALTHASSDTGYSYERLEFLGDRVLGMAVADTLYQKFQTEPEGDLARRLSALVQGRTLAKIAREINLSDHISFSDSERAAGGGENEHILADVIEAMLGAVYLDAGYPACQQVVAKLWGDRFYKMLEPPQHPKTQLQEWAQAKALPLPVYAIENQTGPDHAPIFEVSVTVQGFGSVTASGRSRQEAEKQAAREFFAKHQDKKA